MTWELVEHVDVVEEPPIKGRRVFVSRAVFRNTDTGEEQCRSTNFYDDEPKQDAIDARHTDLLADMNVAPPVEAVTSQQQGDVLERIEAVVAKGKSSDEVVAALLKTLAAFEVAAEKGEALPEVKPVDKAPVDEKPIDPAPIDPAPIDEIPVDLGGV